MKNKRNLYTVILVAVVIIFFSFALACGNSSPEEVKEYSVEYQLAVINESGHVEEDDPVVKEFKTLVDSIDKKAVEGPTEIGDILVTAQEILWNQFKIRISLLELTRNLEKSLPEDSIDLNFEEIAVVYITILGESQ
jgi:hypothetical protein